MTTQKTVAIALQSALNPARFQLDIAAGKTQGTAHTAVQVAITMVNQAEELALEQYNVEVDEFNALCDQLEDTDSKLNIASLELSHLKSEIDDIKLAANQTVLQGEKDMAAAKVSHSQTKNMREELKKLQAMQPEKLKLKVSEQRKKLDDRRELLDSQRLKIRDLKSNLTESETKRVALVGQATMLEDEVKELRSRLIHHDGEVDQKVYHGKDGLEMYLYTFEWGLNFRPASAEIKIVNDVTWHMEVRTNYGICVLVSVTEWLAPFYPPCDYLADRWDSSVHDALVEKITARMELSHPHLVERVEWAKESYLDETDLNEKHVATLNAAGFHSLYSVLHVPPAKLLALVKDQGEKDESVKEKIKGFGEVSVKQVYSKLHNIVAEWESQHEAWKPVKRVSKAA